MIIAREPITKLDKDNFLKQIVRYGYFAEELPTCFTSEILFAKLDDVIPLISAGKRQAKNAKMYSTSPTTLSTFKNDKSRRVVSLPNPNAFLRLCKLLQDNWSEIQNVTKSEHSLSPISFIISYDYGKKVMINSENARDNTNTKSAFIDGIKTCIKASLGYKYRLQVDVSNCYNSIYTHSISWAICGKENAKKYLRTKQPNQLKKQYEFADILDTFTRFQKNNETNGIVVGPFTSRIISEIILASIDRELAKNGYVFKRYVDDYKFYFRTDYQAHASLPIIEKTLNEYNLGLNTEKTKVDKYPYEFISELKKDYEAAEKRGGIFEVLNAAAIHYLGGSKGSYKYALKFIRNKKLYVDDFDLILSSLINIMLLEPKCGKYVISYLKKHRKAWEHRRKDVSSLINNELSSNLENELHQEALLFTQMIMELRLDLSAHNIISIVNSSNDFAIVIALDIWKSRKDSVIRTKSEAVAIRKAIEALSQELHGEEYSGSRWFLLHEIRMHSLIDISKRPVPAANPFFDRLHDCKVTFYKGVGRKLY